jgi:hypothetical protein
VDRAAVVSHSARSFSIEVNMRVLPVCFAAVLGLIVSGAAMAQALPVLSLTKLSRYQPDAVLAERLGEQSSEASAEYFSSLVDAATGVLQHSPRGARGVSAAIVVAIKPGRQARFWIEQGEDLLDPRLVQAMIDAMSKVEPIEVHKGPIALALHVDIWGGGRAPDAAGLPIVIPKAWAATQSDPRARGPMPDGPLSVLWPDDGKKK